MESSRCLRELVMPTFQISITNETFASSNSHDVHSLDDATAQALTAALRIGSEEVAGGKPFFAAEVKVGTANETVGRFVVSIGASPLAISD